jgi:hypothetical protein
MANGRTTISEIDAEVLARMDRTGSEFVPQSRRYKWILDSYKELYDLLVQKFGSDYYFADPYTFQTDGTNDTFALPVDFYKLYGVDLSVNGSPDGWVSIKQFMKGERNNFKQPDFQGVYGSGNMRYRLRGDKIWFSPLPSAGQTIRLLYAPRPNDAGVSTAQASSTIQLSNNTLVSPFSPATPALGTSMTIPSAISGTFQVVWQWRAASAGASTSRIYKNGFPIGLTQNTSSASFVETSEQISTSFVAGDTLEIWIQGPSFVDIQNFHLQYDLVTDFGPQELDGVSGWEQYIVSDVCIKYCGAEETDPQLFMAQKMGLKQRIEEAAENRDVGEPQTVTDVMTDFDPYNGFNGGGYLP